jgi:hypothetical protein
LVITAWCEEGHWRFSVAQLKKVASLRIRYLISLHEHFDFSCSWLPAPSSSLQRWRRYFILLSGKYLESAAGTCMQRAP